METPPILLNQEQNVPFITNDEVERFVRMLYFGNVARRLDFEDITTKKFCGIIKGKNLKLRPIDLNKISYSNLLNDCCSICLRHFEHTSVCETKCSHYYHANCINQWLASHNTCPLCRATI